ncbi:MAG TPA: pyrimidine dimer DNA glycosylase/endonuclease V [Armatimonadota bacterium]|jgi:hypothetical protein
MRVWDLPPEKLCPRHLLAEHYEIHTLWSVLTRGLSGWSHHPETLRWQGRLAALYARHQADVAEMERRGYHHRSPLDATLATGESIQTEYKDAPAEQLRQLREKCAACRERFADFNLPTGELHHD